MRRAESPAGHDEEVVEMEQPLIASDGAAYLQLLVCIIQQNQIVRRLHLRFQSGDESYNYKSANGVFVGLFNPAAAAEAREFAAGHAKALRPLLEDVTLAAAGLRPEDSAAVMSAMLGARPLPLPPAADAVGSGGLYVAVASPDGAVHAGGFPIGEHEPDAPVAALLAQYELIAERLTGAAAKRSNTAVAPPRTRDDRVAPEKKPWWRFW